MRRRLVVDAVAAEAEAAAGETACGPARCSRWGRAAGAGASWAVASAVAAPAIGRRARAGARRAVAAGGAAGQRGRHVGRIGDRALAGEVPADVEGGTAADGRPCRPGAGGPTRRARDRGGRRSGWAGSAARARARSASRAGSPTAPDERELDRAFQQEVDRGQAGGEGARLAADGLAPGADRAGGLVAQVLAVEVVGEPRQDMGGDGIGGGGGAVVAFAVADDQRLVPGRRGVEAAVLGREVRAHALGQALGLAEVAPGRRPPRRDRGGPRPGRRGLRDRRPGAPCPRARCGGAGRPR